MSWWLWLAVGLLLLLGELLTPGGFYLLFFGLAALVVGALVLLLSGMAAWLQWLLFLVIAVAALLAFRRSLLARTRVSPAGHDVDSLVGQVAVPLAPIAPGAVGKAELRGSAWSARNLTDAVLQPAQRCRVERVEGLMLMLRTEE